ncbi:MAG: hypothetical protein RMJ38_03545 [candidate division WOR-3 bacterium]|nr:hypothetical protein [candidate division WOR-3 bacterium]MDW8150496.1 hypothetical protein [candidate division WOR-3 bacterium]
MTKIGKEQTYYGKTSVFEKDVLDFEEVSNLRNIVFSGELILIAQNSIRNIINYKKVRKFKSSISRLKEILEFKI